MSILQIQNVSKYYGAEHIFTGIGFNVSRGERLAIVGVNGAGKSTLLRIIAKRRIRQHRRDFAGAGHPYAVFARSSF
jgi:ATPase subunit of ABC transporter with duplicated ATPase domains